MSYIMGTARNIMLKEVDGKIQAGIEVVMLINQPVYGIDSNGITKAERITDIRFLSTVKTLKTVIKQLESMVEEAQTLEAMVELKEPI